ncbi:MAG: ABC transporter permease subunit [Acetobacteraceae bacterium]|nr:ABC transporter permease subunit [Acetobacteraceae bacterium]
MRPRRGAGFAAGVAFTGLVAVFLIFPVFLSVLAGVTANYQRGVFASGVTLAWVERVLDLYAHTIGLSLGLALATLACTLVLGVPVAYALARNPGRLARLAEEALVMPVAIPGIATGLALILAWGAVGGFRTHWTFILVGHVLFTLPFMVRATLAVMLAVNLPTLEEAARSLGAGFLARFRTVVLPNAAPGILAGSLMVVTLSLGEFNMTSDAAHAVHHDPAGRACRLLRLDAARDRLGLHARLPGPARSPPRRSAMGIRPRLRP